MDCICLRNICPQSSIFSQQHFPPSNICRPQYFGGGGGHVARELMLRGANAIPPSALQLALYLNSRINLQVFKSIMGNTYSYTKCMPNFMKFIEFRELSFSLSIFNDGIIPDVKVSFRYAYYSMYVLRHKSTI